MTSRETCWICCDLYNFLFFLVPHIIIHGPPGTGKSAMVNSVIYKQGVPPGVPRIILKSNLGVKRIDWLLLLLVFVYF